MRRTIMTKSSAIRAGLAALLLAATIVPAAAQSNLQFKFGFGSDGFGYRRPLLCVELTDRQIRNAIGDQGYSNIYLNARDSKRIQARATRGEWVYLLRVSTCTGQILDRDRLRRS